MSQISCIYTKSGVGRIWSSHINKKNIYIGWSSLLPGHRKSTRNAPGTWCVWILVAYNWRHLVHPDTGYIATSYQLPSDRNFPRLIIPQSSMHTTSAPIPNTIHFICYISPAISLFWRGHYKQNWNRSYLIQYWLSQQPLRPTSNPWFLLANILKFFPTMSTLYLLETLLAGGYLMNSDCFLHTNNYRHTTQTGYTLFNTFQQADSNKDFPDPGGHQAGKLLFFLVYWQL